MRGKGRVGAASCAATRRGLISLRLETNPGFETPGSAQLVHGPCEIGEGYRWRFRLGSAAGL